MCQNALIYRFTPVTDSCNRGKFLKKGVLTQPHYNRTDFLDSLFFFKKSNLLLLFNILRPTSLSQFLSPPKHIMY
ncbi:hypothetical protein E5353_05335 [Bacteroides caecimuris]|uniref:Uncharacterized protein n=1 Tax=Bacteroides caecimuris TaxID=1796613 RepID=A0A4S2DDM8_9BACE|nr:hypothetical protein E5353_05335 [Bacteroides caecimuris]